MEFKLIGIEKLNGLHLIEGPHYIGGMDSGSVPEKGCSSCQYAGHIELPECPNAYTEKAKFCNLYSHKTFKKEW